MASDTPSTPDVDDDTTTADAPADRSGRDSRLASANDRTESGTDRTDAVSDASAASAMDAADDANVSQSPGSAPDTRRRTASESIEDGTSVSTRSGRNSSAGADGGDRDGDGERDDDPYEIKPYEPRYRDGYLQLFDDTFGGGTDEWFRWKYEENPYADHVPIVLATCDDQVVGAKPSFPLALRAGDRTVVGYQPADVVVHPDHRRRGLYSRTTERMKDRYADREPSLFFNFPNEATLSGSLKHGWQVVERVPTYYRVNRPERLVEGGRLGWLASALGPAAAGYRRLRDATAPRGDGVTVERYESVPSETFAALYERAVPPTLHADRDGTFYDWRFENPHWRYTAYVARRSGDPVAGVVTGVQTADGTRHVYLTDVVPLANAPGRREGLAAILHRALEDERDADVVAASGRVIDPSLLGQFGFHSDQSVPFSAVGEPTTQVTYPISDDGGHEWTVAGMAIADPTNWTVTFAEQDTA